MFASIFGRKTQTPAAEKKEKEDTIDMAGEETGENSNALNCSEKDLELHLKMENLKLLEMESMKGNFDPIKLFERFMEEKVKTWTYSNLKDEYRPENANKSTGGIDLNNKEITSLIRSTGYEIIKQIGKKIISGDFNLTTVSFPIKVMLPLTILQTIAKSIFQFPLYLNLATLQADPLERFKFVITATLSCFHSSSHFLKPLNPILGETYEMAYEDGSKVYLEQTSHHPPVSHYIMYGPNDAYKFYGYSNFTSSAGLNSLKLNNKGKRFFEFNDGHKITSNFCYEQYSNSFFGTLRHESLGETVFNDLTYGFECAIKYASIKKKPSDFFTGEIKLKNITVCKVSGSYLSYIEFNGIRYWDIRENVPCQSIEVDNQPLSSSLYREDRILLGQRDIPNAQIAKEKLENIQRNDRKLREKLGPKSSSHK